VVVGALGYAFSGLDDSAGRCGGWCAVPLSALTGAALGYGIGFAVGFFRPAWRPVYPP